MNNNYKGGHIRPPKNYKSIKRSIYLFKENIKHKK